MRTAPRRDARRPSWTHPDGASASGWPRRTQPLTGRARSQGSGDALSGTSGVCGARVPPPALPRTVEQAFPASGTRGSVCSSPFSSVGGGGEQGSSFGRPYGPEAGLYGQDCTLPGCGAKASPQNYRGRPGQIRSPAYAHRIGSTAATSIEPSCVPGASPRSCRSSCGCPRAPEILDTAPRLWWHGPSPAFFKDLLHIEGNGDECSTAPVFDDGTKAMILAHGILPPSIYSIFCGTSKTASKAGFGCPSLPYSKG